jgi:hypothetical protein
MGRSHAIYHIRGVSVNCSKRYYYRSPSDEVSVVKIHFIFNGNLLFFVKCYHAKVASRQ